MPLHWIVVTIIIFIAFATCWQRRTAWCSKNYSLDTRSLLIHAAGIALLGPLGEPVGALAHPVATNLEDVMGHVCVLWAAAASAMGAGRILNAPQLLRIVAPATIAGTAAIQAAAHFSGLLAEPSTPGAPGDSSYWLLVPVLLLPGYAIASWANLHVVRATQGRIRGIAAIQAAAYGLGIAGCMCRLVPALPNDWMFWCYGGCLLGLSIAQMWVWKPFRVHQKQVRSLRTVGERRGIRRILPA